MCLSWIISFGAEGCSVNSADFILMIASTTLRSTAITQDEWLLWLQTSVSAGCPQPVWDGAIRQVTGVVWLAKGSLSSLEYKLQHRRDSQQYVIHHLGHFFSPEMNKGFSAPTDFSNFNEPKRKARTNIFIELLNGLQNTVRKTLHLKSSFTPWFHRI